MSVLFSRSCEYAIQAVLYLSNREREGAGPVHLKEISSALRIPHHFLSKLLQTLTHNEIAVSWKGLNGGFELVRPPNRIKLIDIVDAIDGKEFLDKCVLGFSHCDENNACPVHSYWKQAKNYIRDMLNDKTIHDLSKELDEKLKSIDSLV